MMIETHRLHDQQVQVSFFADGPLGRWWFQPFYQKNVWSLACEQEKNLEICSLESSGFCSEFLEYLLDGQEPQTQTVCYCKHTRVLVSHLRWDGRWKIHRKRPFNYKKAGILCFMLFWMPRSHCFDIVGTRQNENGNSISLKTNISPEKWWLGSMNFLWNDPFLGDEFVHCLGFCKWQGHGCRDGPGWWFSPVQDIHSDALNTTIYNLRVASSDTTNLRPSVKISDLGGLGAFYSWTFLIEKIERRILGRMLLQDFFAETSIFEQLFSGHSISIVQYGWCWWIR